MKYQILFPEGKKKAFTLSYDDARYYDRRLVELFNKYHVKSTFHLNAGTLSFRDNEAEYISKDEVRSLYKGHEISCHGLSHPHFSQLPKLQIASELYNDKLALEQLVSYPVRGLSYPFGEYTDETIAVAKALGIEYSRTIDDTMSFRIPGEFMTWDPTCHHDKVYEVFDEFINPPDYRELMLFYVWGHSFEFERCDTWEFMEEFLQKVSGLKDVWYATNIQIKDYVDAYRSLKVTLAEDAIYNPSAQIIWVKVGENIKVIAPGELLNLG